MLSKFLAEYAMPIAYALLTAAAGAAGAWIGRIYKRYVDDKTKEHVVTICCKAIEQIYGELCGAEKYDKAVEAISEMLEAKGVGITEIEIRMLIESVCCEFSRKVKEEAKSEC